MSKNEIYLLHLFKVWIFHPSNEIMRENLDDAGAEVTIRDIAKSKTFPEKLKGDNKTNLLHNEYFKRLLLGGLTAQPPSFTGITCDCFAI